ncbi:PH domain-containing protein [Thalassococcus sp. CAU 1522]|uniref:PH domain-containing protein n=1 Tax=Thalassococcus arenae TaxID=2851652 RepID=A0ABS6N5S1_9RHOB|nr:photosynthetic complex putative assembly protein PuhB [Thalassococcus arenae]MBV2359363.1 PH domain-containing protein [Thalassococcus arenae]
MSHDDFATEPVPGLPEKPPEGEHILWQGRPNWVQLSWEAMSLPWVIGYFVLLALWRFGAVYDLLPLGQAIGASVPFLILGAVVVAALMLVGWVQSVCTLYTVTNKRVAMRIGAALTVTLNIPYRQVANATLSMRGNGTGTIALETMGDTRLSYLVCWPHVRPWVMRRTQPALRCIPDAERVARLIAEAADTHVATPQVERRPSRAAVAAE